MKKIKTCALAGIIAVSTSFGSPAYADTIGCTSPNTFNINEAIAQLEQVIAALEQWISERTPADPNYATLTGLLQTAQNNLDFAQSGQANSKAMLYSAFACNIDVSPA